MTENEKSTGCEIADNLLSAYLDDELDEKEIKLVQEHVVDCDICPGVLDDMESTANAMATLPKEAIPEHDLWEGIVAGYDGSNVVSLSEERQKRSGWFGMTKGQLIAAGIGVLMLPGVFAGGMMVGMAADGERDYKDNGIVRVIDRAREPRPPQAQEPVLVVPRAPVAPVAPQVGQMIEQYDRAMERADRARERYDQGRARAMVEVGLIQALSDPSGDVSRQAAISLGEMDNLSDEATQALIGSLLSHRDGETRRWSAIALGEIGDESAVAPLMQALRTDSNAEVRRWAAYSMGEIGHPMAAEALTEALADGSADVRRWAAWALSEIADGF